MGFVKVPLFSGPLYKSLATLVALDWFLLLFCILATRNHGMPSDTCIWAY